LKWAGDGFVVTFSSGELLAQDDAGLHVVRRKLQITPPREEVSAREHGRRE